MLIWFVIIKKGEIVRMYKVLMITNPSIIVIVVVPNRLSKQVLTVVLKYLKTA